MLISCRIFIGWLVNVDRNNKHTVRRSCCIVGYLWSQDCDNGHLWTSVRHRITKEPWSQKSPRSFHNANLSSGTAENRAVFLGLKRDPNSSVIPTWHLRSLLQGSRHYISNQDVTFSELFTQFSLPTFSSAQQYISCSKCTKTTKTLKTKILCKLVSKHTLALIKH